MVDLFAPPPQDRPPPEASAEAPLADRLRPRVLAEIIGQDHLTGPEGAISIVVPCHRVIGSSGKLIGYGGGLDRKQTLLELERARDRLL